MRTVRLTATILYYLARGLAFLIFAITAYALILLLIHRIAPSASLPLQVSEGIFHIYLPFTHTVFLIGEPTTAFIVTNFLTFAFYGLFLWLLSGVFQAFRQEKLFTSKSVRQLSLFYGTNLAAPLIFLGLLAIFGTELQDMIRIILLHLVIGVFAFFMAAIFRQGVVLQEEQDLTF
jgi:hypothetical protein